MLQPFQNRQEVWSPTCRSRAKPRAKPLSFCGPGARCCVIRSDGLSCSRPSTRAAVVDQLLAQVAASWDSRSLFCFGAGEGRLVLRQFRIAGLPSCCVAGRQAGQRLAGQRVGKIDAAASDGASLVSAGRGTGRNRGDIYCIWRARQKRAPAPAASRSTKVQDDSAQLYASLDHQGMAGHRPGVLMPISASMVGATSARRPFPACCLWAR